MGRIRTIKPEFWRHEALSELPEATHMLAAALLSYADDEGYFNANPKLVLAECFPLREPSVSIPESLRSLSGIGYIRLGKGPDGRSYGHVVGFLRHQKVSHPAKSKISCLSITWQGSGEPPEGSGESLEDLRPEQGTGNREQGGSVDASASTAAEGGPTAGAEVIDLSERRPPAPPPQDDEAEDEDPVKVLFDRGIPFLLRHGVPNEAQARTFIGQCRKIAKDTEQGDFAVLEAFRACRKEGVSEPRAWIMATLQQKPSIDFDAVFDAAMRKLNK